MGTWFHSLKRAVPAAAVLLGASGLVAALRHAPNSALLQHGGVDAQGAATLTWVFDLDELLLSCDPPTSVLRQLQQRLGERISVSALYVGADSERARAFLATERLPIPVSLISEAEYRDRFPSHSRPIVVYTDGRIQKVLDARSWAVREGSRPTELESVVTRMAFRHTPAE